MNMAADGKFGSGVTTRDEVTQKLRQSAGR